MHIHITGYYNVLMILPSIYTYLRFITLVNYKRYVGFVLLVLKFNKGISEVSIILKVNTQEMVNWIFIVCIFLPQVQFTFLKLRKEIEKFE